MKRDNFTCQLCGRSDRGLNVHHIKYQNDLDYWDYPDELLLTVCPVCHAKIHGKPVPAEQKPKRIIKRTKIRASKPKTVFYTYLLTVDSLTANDKIVYSFLIYKAYCDSNADGKVNVAKMGKLRCKAISNYKIAKDLSLSINTVTSSLKRIEDAGLFESDDEYFYLAYTDEIKESKYFLLCQNSGLKGDKLIYYSYLKSKSEYYGGVVPQKDYIQYREMNISRKYYQKIICELKKLGLAERLPNGKLKVN